MSHGHLDTDQRRSGDHQDPDLHCSTEGGPPAGGEQMVGILCLFVETPSMSLAVSNMCVGLFLEKIKTPSVDFIIMSYFLLYFGVDSYIFRIIKVMDWRLNGFLFKTRNNNYNNHNSKRDHYSQNQRNQLKYKTEI